MLKTPNPNLSAVINSIRDEDNPFDMRSWSTCICGHIRQVAANRGLSYSEVKPFEFIGLDPKEAGPLFTVGELTDEQCRDRELAVERILQYAFAE